MDQKKRRTYTVLFVPDDNEKPFSVRIGRYSLWCSIAAIALFIVGITLLLLNVGKIGIKLQMTYQLIIENRRLTEENEKLRSAAAAIVALDHTSGYLRRIIRSVGEYSPEASLTKLTHGYQTATRARNPLSDPTFDTTNLSDSVEGTDALSTTLLASGRFMSEVENATGAAASANTSPDIDLKAIPNIPPCQGWIVRPFEKKNQLHGRSHGVSFACRSGSLVSATAAGMVQDIAQDSVFGLIITVRHRGGFVSRYGYCKLAVVSPGDFVMRGQLIALVGSASAHSFGFFIPADSLNATTIASDAAVTDSITTSNSDSTTRVQKECPDRVQCQAGIVYYEVLKDGKNIDPQRYMIYQ
ncbi:MAG: M23 family metallopeptidase [Chitinivibrionales bacterium]|nr:M23 family metallopeptidase [Chitinivibrionales bacterium]